MEKNNNFIEIINLMKQSTKRDGLQEIISKPKLTGKIERRDPLGNFVIKSTEIQPSDVVINVLNIDTEDQNSENTDGTK